jgi:hypothetical protein
MPENKIKEIIQFIKRGLFTSKFDVKIANSSHLYCRKFLRLGGYGRSNSAIGAKGRPLIILLVAARKYYLEKLLMLLLKRLRLEF